MNGKRIGTKLLILAVFAVAMAHLEGVAVVYIQRILDHSSGGDFQGYLVDRGITTLQGFTEYLEGREILWVERGREVATIVMLLCIALLAARSWRQFLAYFLWTFAIWDIVYYVSLRLLSGWPGSLGDLDCLFLIPIPWFAPVWFPLAVMVVLIYLSLRLLAWDGKL
jgi:ABC-type multidrug transport system fused ATPase/permease subunit